MNDDESPTAGLDAGEFHAMLQSWWALLAWEVTITALTVVMLSQHLGLATAAGVIDLAAVAQTLRVVKNPRHGHGRRRGGSRPRTNERGHRAGRRRRHQSCCSGGRGRHRPLAGPHD